MTHEHCGENRQRLADEFRSCRSLFTAFGDENRQQIILTLLEAEQVGLRVGYITEQTHLSRPAVSHHLKILKEAGVISLKKIGTKNYYYINATNPLWKELRDFTAEVYQIVNQASGCGYPEIGERND
ncbi:MAG: ArsR/SmtB family transcription factor [Eubacteriaceae bacterium]|jgi:DNA-binding transcriptional ArsR family regulator